MAHSPKERGVHLFLTPLATGEDAPNPQHWYFDLVHRGFWRDAYQADHQPTAVCEHDGDILIACADGGIRTLEGDDDDGEDVVSHVLIGPIRLGEAGEYGMIQSIHGMIDGAATWRIVLGDTAQDAADNAKAAVEAYQAEGDWEDYVHSSGNWGDGRSHKTYPRARGVWAVLWIQSAAQWAYERITLETDLFGRWR